MKIAILALSGFFAFTCLYAQKIEIVVQANSGLFHYAGTSSTGTSAFNSSGGNPAQYYTNNPYGAKNGFSYGFGIQAQRVSKSGFIAGLQAGYDLLRSKVTIDRIIPLVYFYNTLLPFDYVPYPTPVQGQTFLTDQSINVSPYLGYRLKIKKIKIDLLPGIDLAFNINSYDKGKATGNDGTIYQTNLKLSNAPTDIRLKFRIAAAYKKLGITAGYAHGLTNLDKNTTGDGSYNAHSELIRFGVTYRILW